MFQQTPLHAYVENATNPERWQDAHHSGRDCCPHVSADPGHAFKHAQPCLTVVQVKSEEMDWRTDELEADWKNQLCCLQLSGLRLNDALQLGS